MISKIKEVFFQNESAEFVSKNFYEKFETTMKKIRKIENSEYVNFEDFFIDLTVRIFYRICLEHARYDYKKGLPLFLIHFPS